MSASGGLVFETLANDQQDVSPSNLGVLLVADDSPASLQVLYEILTTQGYQVHCALGGEAALETAGAVLPDLILLDIKMPDLDGLEVCRRLKKAQETRDIPVIFISALNELFDKVQAFQLGAVDYITKPFEMEEVLARVATHLSLRRLHEHLSRQNQALTEALTQLQRTQQQLIESEKLAALGNLVAGIAHEINTPIGIGVTAASTLADETAFVNQQFKSGQFTRSAVETYLRTAHDSSDLILNNLRRAADLVQSLKLVSADQIYLERRRFDVHSYLQEVLCSLAPTLKHTPHTVLVEGEDVVTLESYPGAFSQVITNLVINSITHAFPTGETGTLHFAWRQDADLLRFSYADNGCGIPSHAVHQIFDPFFTTARGSGGTGLGLHIVYSLVTKKMGGKIYCESPGDRGTRFSISLPLVAPHTSHNELPALTLDA
ncbi:MAG: hybrid sensor histidine kinase/response regulator [Caldilineaceae bacterium]|nr:hybrid sensor histidine kinase/response regulator [Caldilineaceae bacterium]